MQDVTWVGVVGILLLLSQLLNIYNSSKTARKNAEEPLKELRKEVNQNKTDLGRLVFRMEKAEADINHAHDKIRENEESTGKIAKAQSKALLAILLWIKDPQHEDMKRIDDAIREISVI